MNKPYKLGLVIGALMAGFHVFWIVLVALGWAQPLMDFIFWAHMITPIYVVKPFDPVAATILILVTFGMGYTFGFIGSLLWNKLRGASVKS